MEQLFDFNKFDLSKLDINSQKSLLSQSDITLIVELKLEEFDSDINTCDINTSDLTTIISRKLFSVVKFIPNKNETTIKELIENEINYLVTAFISKYKDIVELIEYINSTTDEYYNDQVSNKIDINQYIYIFKNIIYKYNILIDSFELKDDNVDDNVFYKYLLYLKYHYNIYNNITEKIVINNDTNNREIYLNTIKDSFNNYDLSKKLNDELRLNSQSN